MRPFFPYYGSKWALARQYPAPRHDLVIEAFAGAAGYATYYDAPCAFLYDTDPIIVGVWRYLMAATAAEILTLPEMPEVGDCVDNYALPPEAKWLIGFWLNRGSSTPKKSRTAFSARTDKAQLNWGPRAKERIAAQIPFISGWTITEGDFSKAPPVSATYFVDPPYQQAGKHYRHAFADYERLATWVETRPGLVIACEGEGADWLPFRELGSFKSTRGRATERLYLQESEF